MRTLYLHYLHEDIANENLKELFLAAGVVARNIDLRPTRNQRYRYAAVEFDSAESAQLVHTRLHGKSFMGMTLEPRFNKALEIKLGRSLSQAAANDRNDKLESTSSDSDITDEAEAALALSAQFENKDANK